ncbi:MAG: type II toxin-antitoxin system Phd/YefM family antitoxin [Rickettsia sp.]|uniref:type II toxin-antitoxin system Phd/YefM family antitoxin n=1 Tax=Rickettsia sp. TaxID=789 RepID=UPI003979E659
MEHIYANLTVSISEFKKSPTALLDKASGEPVALLNHNKPTAYLISAELYARIIEALDDNYLLEFSKTRLKDKEKAIAVKSSFCHSRESGNPVKNGKNKKII